MTMRWLTLVGLLILSLSPQRVRAQAALPNVLTNVGFDQRLDAEVPLDLAFTDEDGNNVRLRDFFRGKPVILVFAYFRCPMLCTQVLNGLAEAMREVPFTAGREFRVVTVSFDPNDSPRMAAAKKRTYLRYYGHPDAVAGWSFLTGSKDSIASLTKAAGFRYAYDARSDQYAHAAGIVVLTPSGRISRYFYDVHFNPRDLRLGLVEASQNRIGSAVDQILLFCFHYDPNAGRYGATIINIVRAGGALTVIGLVIMVALLLRGERKRLKRPRTLASEPSLIQHVR